MLITPIINQLATQCPEFKIVQGAIELARDVMRPPVMPCAYVLNVRETVAENQLYAGAISQKVMCTIGVVIMLKDVSDQLGASASETLDDLLRKTRNALAGFVPPNTEESTPLELAEYQLVDFSNQIVIAQQNFTTSYLFRKL